MDLYVSNLPFSATENQLRQTFEMYGQVTRLAIIRDQYTGVDRGAALVEMPKKEDAIRAMQALNGMDFNGRPLSVREATDGLDIWQQAGTFGYSGATEEPRPSDQDENKDQ